MSVLDETSGSTEFTLLTQEIIEEAFDCCQMGVEGEDISGGMYKRGLRSLNLMLTTWQGQGIHLWTYVNATLFPVGTQGEYTLDNERFVEDYTRTATSADALSGATTVTIDDATGIADDYFIGLYKSDCEIFWTTVSSFVGDVITLADGLPEDMDEGTVVIWYEKTAPGVERALSCFRVDSFVNESPIELLSAEEYWRLPNKEQTGVPAQSYYDRQARNGVLRLWPVPQDGRQLVMVLYERRIEDFVSSGDLPDMPKQWLEALAWNLAKRLAIKYRVPQSVKNDIELMADETLNQALAFDNENAPIKLNLGDYR